MNSRIGMRRVGIKESSSIMWTVTKVIAGCALALWGVNASAEDDVAAPFGVVIGEATCEHARALLRGSYERPGTNSFGWAVLRAGDADALYPGATVLALSCLTKDAPVHYLLLRASVGAESAATKRAYDELQKRYRLLSGDLVNNRGTAVFQSGSITIDLTATDADSFTVEYMTPDIAARKRASVPLNKQPAGRL